MTKIGEVYQLFREQTKALLEQGRAVSISQQYGSGHAVSPKMGFLLEGSDDTIMLVDGIVQKANGQFNVSIIDNIGGTLKRQTVNFDHLQKLHDIGAIHPYDGNSGAALTTLVRGVENSEQGLEKTSFLNEIGSSTLFMLIRNGFYDQLCLSSGHELDVKPVICLRDRTDMPMFVSNIKQNGKEWVITYFGPDEWQEDIDITETSIQQIDEMFRQGQISLDSEFIPTHNMAAYREAYMSNGFMTGNPELLSEAEKTVEISRRNNEMIFNPEKDHIDRLKKGDISFHMEP